MTSLVDFMVPEVSDPMGPRCAGLFGLPSSASLVRTAGDPRVLGVSISAADPDAVDPAAVCGTLRPWDRWPDRQPSYDKMGEGACDLRSLRLAG
jgi:hypothetical protein